MAKMKVYLYEKCDGCRKAKKYLDSKKVAYEAVPIAERPPSRKELETMLARVGDLKRLFNTSGKEYRSRGLSKKLPTMPKGEALALLAKNGMLVKRPFVLTGKTGLLGFKPDEWKKVFG
jgi:Spx/MgsR family transcriptional regulator